MIASSSFVKATCFHCGDDCPIHPIYLADKTFCCDGCRTVYQLLQDNGLCTYYDLDQHPGLKIKTSPKDQYAYLDNDAIARPLFSFCEGDTARITLSLPGIHCSSCIWLLENLHKLEKGVMSSRVQFLRKEIDLVFHPGETSLRRLVEVLDTLGYAPDLHLDAYNKRQSAQEDRSLYFKLGIAGFCASNIMLFSFPEYFGLDRLLDQPFRALFTYLCLLFSLPVVLYSASDYFASAWKSIRQGMVNLDVPIALGTLAVFLRSVYEVLAHVGPGYFDSLTGLVFFLLIGKWVQKRTYHQFSFDKDYQSYFPLSVIKMEGGKETHIPLHGLVVGDEIVVKQNQIVPADAVLMMEATTVDYSFVTGESKPVQKQKGDLLFAGGRLLGQAVQLRVTKEVSKSYLLQLWNQEVFRKNNDAYLSSFVLAFGKYFVWGTLVVASTTGLYWYWADPSRLLFAVTSVLLVACPCALALALPFALGNCLRVLAKRGLLLKNADTVEQLAQIDTIVFDKTGTLTQTKAMQLVFVGTPLSMAEQSLIRSAASQSLHPMSQAVATFLQAPFLPVTSFNETTGKGIDATVANCTVRMGAGHYLLPDQYHGNESRLYVAFKGLVRGYFQPVPTYRKGYRELLEKLSRTYDLHLLSGDTDQDKGQFEGLFAQEHMHFGQLPTDKLSYVQQLQAKGRKVLMVGDGLNDAGALKAANVGLTVAETASHFIPACDGLCEAQRLMQLPHYLHYTQMGMAIVKASLCISLLYNVVGLYFAVQGQLSPLIAAILMPLSSVSVVLFAVLGTTLSKASLRTVSLSIDKDHF